MDQDISAEYVLYRDLFHSQRHGFQYQRTVRPVHKHSDPITVYVGMCVIMIEEIVERDQMMSMAACLKLRWVDQFLMWNIEKYNNLTWIAVTTDKIWLPDIAIINSPEPYLLTKKETNVEIQHNGEVGYYPSGKLFTRCNIWIKFFPLDWQRCDVRLESWIYPTDQLNLVLYPEETIDIKSYYSNHEWAVTDYKAVPVNAQYDGKNFSSINFIYILRRKPAYYFTYFVFPQTLLAVLQTLSSTLPVEHPGRMAMLTSLFIGTSVTQASVADMIPKSSDSMSLLQMYMALISCNIVMSLIVTCLMMYVVLRYPNEEPSIAAIFIAFFNIAWPEKKKDEEPLALNLAASLDEKAEDNVPEMTNLRKILLKENGYIKAASKRDQGDQVRRIKSFSHRLQASCDSEGSPMVNLSQFANSRQAVTDDLDSSPVTMNIPNEPSFDYLKPKASIDLSENIMFRERKRSATKAIQNMRKRIFNMGSSVGDRPGISTPLSPQDDFDMYHVSASKGRRKSVFKSKRGVASISDDTRELRRRWLLYCVALDKIFMYLNFVWNAFVPIFLFLILPQVYTDSHPHDIGEVDPDFF